MKKKIKLSIANTIPFIPLAHYNPDLLKTFPEDDYEYLECCWLMIIMHAVANGGNIGRLSCREEIKAPHMRNKYDGIFHWLVTNGEFYRVTAGEVYRSLFVDAIMEKKNKIATATAKAANARWHLPRELVKQKEKPVAKNKPAPEKDQPKEVPPTKVVVEIKVKKETKASIERTAEQLLREAYPDETLYQTSLEWLKVRKIKKVPNTEGAITRMIKRLNQLSNGDAMAAVAILDKSIRSGWADVFPINEKALMMQNTSYESIYNQLKQKHGQ